MSKERIEGVTQKAVGAAKQTIGKAVGNERLQAEGEGNRDEYQASDEISVIHMNAMELVGAHGCAELGCYSGKRFARLRPFAANAQVQAHAFFDAAAAAV